MIQVLDEAAKGKIADTTLKDIDTYSIATKDSQFLSSEEQQRVLTLPNGKPCQTYTNGTLSMVLSGDDEWTENQLGTGCIIAIDPDPNRVESFMRWYPDPSEAARDFKAMTVDFDNGVLIGDIIKEYGLDQA